MKNVNLDFILYVFKTRYEFSLRATVTPASLEKFIFEHFSETLPYFVTHRTRLLLNGKNIMLKPNEKIATMCCGSAKAVMKVEFQPLPSLCQSQLESSWIAEADTMKMDEIVNDSEVSSIRNAEGQSEVSFDISSLEEPCYDEQ